MRTLGWVAIWVIAGMTSAVLGATPSAAPAEPDYTEKRYEVTGPAVSGIKRSTVPAEPGEMAPEHAKLNTADATPVDPGHVELEVGYRYARARRFWDSRGKSRSRDLREENELGLSLTMGVVENLDFNISVPYLWVHDRESDFSVGDDAIGDLAAGARFRFLQSEKHQLQAAVISGLKVPTGTRGSAWRLGTSQEFWSWDNILVLTKDWGRWTANADLGFSLPFGKRRDTARGVFSANLAAGYQVLDWLQPEAELNYAREFFSGEADGQDLSATAGVVMPLSERWRINLGLQQSVWGRNTDKTTTFLLAVKVAF